jgi:hypothetical protein
MLVLGSFAIYSDKKNYNQIKEQPSLECNKMFCVGLFIENEDGRGRP